MFSSVVFRLAVLQNLDLPTLASDNWATSAAMEVGFDHHHCTPHTQHNEGRDMHTLHSIKDRNFRRSQIFSLGIISTCAKKDECAFAQLLALRFVQVLEYSFVEFPATMAYPFQCGWINPAGIPLSYCSKRGRWCDDIKRGGIL